MERLGELAVFLCLVATVAVLLLGTGSEARPVRVVGAALIGVTGAFAVIVQEVDVVPDDLEMPLAFLALLGFLAALTVVHVRQARERDA